MKKALQFLTMVVFLLGMAAAAYSQAMPNAITIAPEGATVFDQVTLTFNANLSCTPEGKGDLKGLEQIAMHAGIKKLGSTWDSWGEKTVEYNGTPGGGYTTKLTANGDGTYSMTFVPADYFGVTAEDGVYIGISCVFNNGNNWDSEGKDTGDGTCKDFQIPFRYVSGEPVANFYLNMKKVLETGDFTPGVDKVYVVVEGLGTFDMIDLDANFDTDSIYFVKVEAGLVKDETYEYYYRINDDQNEEVTREFVALGGPNTFNDWWNDDPIVYPAYVDFLLDMTYPIANGLFNPASDYIDVAGSFNGWGPAAGEFQLVVTADPNVYTIKVDLEAGNKYEFKFRFNSNWDNSEFPAGGPNREFTPVEGEQEVVLAYNTMVYFSVDMSKAIDAGDFDPESDFVDVNGGFYGWAGSPPLASLGENSYGIKISQVKPGEVMEYKFRINANWDTSEYPGGGPNRQYTVEYGYQVVHHFYDAVANVTHNPLEAISFFPNPVSGRLIVLNADSIDRIMIVNMMGQEVKVVENPASRVEISTTDIKQGLYFVNFVSSNGTKRTEKIVVQ